MKKTKHYLFQGLVLCFLLIACSKEPDISGDLLDGNTLAVEDLYKKSEYLLSHKTPSPSEADKNKPVIILGHGFSATVFEWNEFRDWIEKNHKGDILISQVLLEGHGRDYQAFKNATWQQWQASLTQEYEELLKKGYKNISFAGASTSGTLILNLIGTEYFNRFQLNQRPKNIFLIDPLVIPSSRFLSLIDYLGSFVGYSDSGSDDDHDLLKKHWYRYYPQEALKQLYGIATKVKEGLEDGIRVPNNAYLKLYKTTRDKTVAPVSAVLIYKGLRSSMGGKIDIEMIDSDFHVYTRLVAREGVSEKDEKYQQDTFGEIYQKLIKE